MSTVSKSDPKYKSHFFLPKNAVDKSFTRWIRFLWSSVSTVKSVPGNPSLKLWKYIAKSLPYFYWIESRQGEYWIKYPLEILSKCCCSCERFCCPFASVLFRGTPFIILRVLARALNQIDKKGCRLVLIIGMSTVLKDLGVSSAATSFASKSSRLQAELEFK